MKRLRSGFAGLLKHRVMAAAVLMFICSFTAGAQQVVGVSAILGSTNASQIDTYSATELDYSASYYYDAGVGGYLYQNGSLIRSGWAASGSYSDIAYGYMTAPTSVGADYQLEGDHYLIAAYMVWYEGQSYYSNPYGYSFSPAGGGSSSTGFEPGGGDAYITTEYIYLGTTAIGVATAPPYIGGIREWANGGTYGLRGTSGYIEVYGQHLLDAFDGGTTPAMSGSGVSVSVDYASAVQVNLYYTIDSTASTGNRTLTLRTRFGTSNGATFTVADPTPNISSISPDPWDAGGVVNFTISGTGFGSNPSISVSGSGVGTSGVYTSGDTQISAWADLTYASEGTTTVTVTSNGWGGNGFAPAPQGGSTSQTSKNAQVRRPSCGDERDGIIQQYPAYGASITPSCGDFTNNPQPSPNFSFSELQSRDGASWAILRSQLLNGLEAIRSSWGSAISLSSGYRTPAHNRAEGSTAPNSPHIYGKAADIRVAENATWNALWPISKAAQACIEPRRYTGTWMHVDWRDTPCPAEW